MEKLEIRAVIKYFCKECFQRKIKTSWKPLGRSHIEKNGQQSLRGERVLRMMDGPAALKMPSLMKLSRTCIPWLCVIGGEGYEA